MSNLTPDAGGRTRGGHASGVNASGTPGQAVTEPGRNDAPRRRNTRTTQRHHVRAAILSASLAVGLTAAGGTVWALDRFVIPHSEVTDVAAAESAAAQSWTTTTATATTDATDATADPTIDVQKVVTGTGDDTVTYYVANVTLGDATQLRSAFANDTFGENITQTTSEMAEANNAVFAINGDYYGFRDTGIEIRNGVVYRDEGAREGLAFFRDGSVTVYDETTTDAETLVADGVWNTLSFGPAIVEDSAVVDGIDSVEVDTNFGNHSIQGQQPRTAVGVIDDNHLVFVVVDGRDVGTSRGVTMTELAEIMVSLGATTAYNLDGGGSSTMFVDGEVINQPSNGGERGTSDILYVAAS